MPILTLDECHSTPPALVMTSWMLELSPNITRKLSQLIPEFKSFNSSLDDDELKEMNSKLIDVLEDLQTESQVANLPVCTIPFQNCKPLNLLAFSTHCSQILTSLLSIQLAYNVVMTSGLLIVKRIRLRLLGKLMI